MNTIVPRLSFACPASSCDAEADRLYDTLRGDRESLRVTTADGQTFRAYRDGRGVTVKAKRRVVYLHSPRVAAAYVARLYSSPTLGTVDERHTLAALIESMVSL